MNLFEMNAHPIELPVRGESESSRGILRKLNLTSGRTWEIPFLILVLALSNFFPAGFGSAAQNLALWPSAIVDGQWWRLITFALVHISPYHLALDGISFLGLFGQLEGNYRQRWGRVLLCTLMSGIVPLLFSSEIGQVGLVGLSGAAHGIMLIICLQMARSPERLLRRMSIVFASGLIVKTVLEQVGFAATFHAWHAGEVGVPMPLCHLGGLVGSLLSLMFFPIKWRQGRELARES